MTEITGSYDGKEVLLDNRGKIRGKLGEIIAGNY